MKRQIIVIIPLAVAAITACTGGDEVAETESRAVESDEAATDSASSTTTSEDASSNGSSSDEESSSAECAPGPGKTITDIEDVVVPAVDIPAFEVEDTELPFGETVPGFEVPAVHIPERVIDTGCIIEYHAPGGCLPAVEITGFTIPEVEVPGFSHPATEVAGKQIAGVSIEAVTAEAVHVDGDRAEQECQRQPADGEGGFVHRIDRRGVNRFGTSQGPVFRSGPSWGGECIFPDEADFENNDADDYCIESVRIPMAEIPRVAVPGTFTDSESLPGGWLEGTEATVFEGEDETAYVAPADVLFDFDRSDVRADAVPTLEAIVAAIEDEFDAYTITVEGHTDDVGTPDYNQQLSEDRATAVAEWLTTRGGIEPDLVTTTGYGETAPAAPNNTPEGQAQNRRVVITVHPD